MHVCKIQLKLSLAAGQPSMFYACVLHSINFHSAYTVCDILLFKVLGAFIIPSLITK